jgi:hypothetical protein
MTSAEPLSDAMLGRRRAGFGLSTGMVAIAVALALGNPAPGLAQGPTTATPAAPPAAPAPTASGQLDPRNLALANEIIDISYPPATRHDLLARATDAMMEQGRLAAAEVLGDQLNEGTRPILDRFLSRVRSENERLIAAGSPALFAAVARAYARTFTHDELVQIRAFVATPAGARFVQQADDLLTDPDVARANTAYMAAAMAALQPLEAQMLEELRAHFQGMGRLEGEPATGTR